MRGVWIFSGTTQSTEMLVVVFTSQLYKVIDEFKVTTALRLDLSKAFVCIHHETLKKLCYRSISDNTMYAQKPSQNVPSAGYLAAYNAISAAS